MTSSFGRRVFPGAGRMCYNRRRLEGKTEEGKKGSAFSCFVLNASSFLVFLCLCALTEA